MAKYKLEYIWLDGYAPVPNLRGKTQIKEFDSFPKLEELPMWGFDGSSTMQAEGHSSDCVLKPVAVYPDPRAQRRARHVRSHDARRQDPAPDQQARDHPRRSRRLVRLRAGVLPLQGRPPARLPGRRLPAPQGEYYTGVGYKNVGDVAREIVEEHLDLCLAAGINHEGINAEVAKGQWEFQIFGKGSKKAADQMWMARYLCCASARSTAWTSNATASRSATPTGTAPACTPTSRPSTCARSAARSTSRRSWRRSTRNKNEHIAVYGPDNHLRLTGLHETASIDKFNYGVANRGASIRVPHSFVNNGYKGYLEDRRPNSQGDPYKIASQILKTIATVPAGPLRKSRPDLGAIANIPGSRRCSTSAPRLFGWLATLAANGSRKRRAGSSGAPAPPIDGGSGRLLRPPGAPFVNANHPRHKPATPSAPAGLEKLDCDARPGGLQAAGR